MIKGVNKFRFGEAYILGIKLHEEVSNSLPVGRAISCPEDMGLLAQIICDSSGDHLEIGTAVGGSAIIAQKVLDTHGRKSKVVCIDPFASRTPHTDAQNGFWRNVKHHGLMGKFEMILARSHPFPVEKGRRFATALIDGDHAPPQVMNDWMNTKGVVDNYIMFHDYFKSGVHEVVLKAAQDPEWSLVAVHGWSAVLWKLNPKN